MKDGLILGCGLLLIIVIASFAISVNIIGWVIAFWLFKVNPLWGIGAFIFMAIFSKNFSPTVKVKRG